MQPGSLKTQLPCSCNIEIEYAWINLCFTWPDNEREMCPLGRLIEIHRTTLRIWKESLVTPLTVSRKVRSSTPPKYRFPPIVIYTEYCIRLNMR